MTDTINHGKLTQLEALGLDRGGHDDFDDGHCAMELVSWLADEGFTDAPACASPVIRRYVIRLNDRWDDGRRQQLKPFLPRMVGTGSDGRDDARYRIAAAYAVTMVGEWLRLAGLDSEAERLANAGPVDIRQALSAASRAAWKLRRQSITSLREKIRAHLAEKNAAADAVADAAADAAAAAAADAVAVAVAAAAADAAAAAAADAAAVAVAAAAAVAVDVAAADAVDVDVAAAAAAAADKWGAVYSAARTYYRAHPLPITERIQRLAAKQDGQALVLLDKLISADEGDAR